MFNPTKLFKFRRRHGLTQKELGAEIGVSGKTISRWECGKSEPIRDYLILEQFMAYKDEGLKKVVDPSYKAQSIKVVDINKELDEAIRDCKQEAKGLSEHDHKCIDLKGKLYAYKYSKELVGQLAKKGNK